MNVMKLMVVALAGWRYLVHDRLPVFTKEFRSIPGSGGSVEKGEVGCRERLGGLPRYDYRDAA